MNDNFAKCPEEALEWNSRRYLIIEELIEYCPDIICLQVTNDSLDFECCRVQLYNCYCFPGSGSLQLSKSYSVNTRLHWNVLP